MESRRGPPRRPRPTVTNSFFDNAYNNTLTGNEFNTVNGNQSRTTNNDNRRTKNRYEGADNRSWERTWNDNRYASGVNNGANGTVNFGYVPQRESSPHDQNPRRSPGYNPGYSSGLDAETQPEEPPSFLDPTYQAYQRSQQRAGSLGESHHSDSDYDSDTPHQNGAYFTRGDRNNGDYRNPQPNHSGFSQTTAYAYPDTVVEQRSGPLNDHSQRQSQDLNVGVQEAYSDQGQDISETPLYPAGAAQNHDNDITEPFHETYESDPSNDHVHNGNDHNINNDQNLDGVQALGASLPNSSHTGHNQDGASNVLDYHDLRCRMMSSGDGLRRMISFGWSILWLCLGAVFSVFKMLISRGNSGLKKEQ